MSFFYEEAGSARTILQSPIPLENKAPRSGAKANAAVAALAQASRKCTFAQLAEDTPVPYAACRRKNLRLYAAGRRKMWMRTRKNTICTSY